MLLSFSMENFRSFRSEETFSLLASKRLADAQRDSHTIPIPGIDEQVLRVASCYGANGAGKSNLVHALLRLRQLVLSGSTPGARLPYEPFAFDDATRTRPTGLDLQFLAQGEVFRYGVVYDATRVHEEWLSVYEGAKEREVFSRVSNENGGATIELEEAAKGKFGSAKLMALAQVGARPNQLFLSEVVNLDDPSAQGVRFHQAIEWFASTLSIMEADARCEQLAEAIAADETFIQFASRFLREAGTGISDIEVQASELSRAELSSIAADVWEKSFAGLQKRKVESICRTDGREFFLEFSAGDKVKVREISALHTSPKGEETRLPFHEESDGVRRLFQLLPALHLLTTKGGVFVIDEFERSMHPLLAWKFVEFFQKAADGPNSQLIFTTHESTLLDQDLQRRDGIWFVEKDGHGASHLHSLAEFKVRNDRRIEKGYLEGRFGAVPFLGGIDRLMGDRSAVEGQV